MDRGFEEELEKELYQEKKTTRPGRVKRVWGVKRKKPEDYELWQESLSVPERFFNLKKLFFILFSLFLISLGVFAFVVYYRSVFIRGVDLEIIGPLEVNPLDDYEYLIKINNNSLYLLREAKLEIVLKNGAFFEDEITESKVFNLGDIEPKFHQEIKLKLFFVGQPKQIAKIGANLIYFTEKKNQSFQTSKELGVSLKKEAISFQIFKPNRVFIGEPFMLSLKIINNTQKSFNLDLSWELPESLEIVSLTPLPTELTNWKIDKFEPNSPFEINAVLKFKTEPLNPVVNILPKINYGDREFSLNNVYLSFNAIKSPVTLKIEVDPPDEIVGLEKTIKYRLDWENKSSISLNNVSLKVYFNGPFDYESLKTDGYFSALENSLIWTAQNNPALYIVKPGSSGSVGFSLKTVDKYPEGLKNLTLSVRAILETESLPPEVQIYANKFSIEAENTKIIHGKIAVTPRVIFADENLENKGPFPLERGKPTTLSFYLAISTWAEDFENIIIKTKIPLGVKLTGVFGGEFKPENFFYNPETGEWVYRLDELQAGFGNLYNEYLLLQQIEVTPPLYGEFNRFVVIPKMTISAKGKFSNQTFELTTDPITIGEIKK